MKKKKEDKTTVNKPKSESNPLKPGEQDQIHSGYNEKNHAQPQGAFTPDSKTGKE